MLEINPIHEKGIIIKIYIKSTNKKYSKTEKNNIQFSFFIFLTWKPIIDAWKNKNNEILY